MLLQFIYSILIGGHTLSVIQCYIFMLFILGTMYLIKKYMGDDILGKMSCIFLSIFGLIFAFYNLFILHFEFIHLMEKASSIIK